MPNLPVSLSSNHTHQQTTDELHVVVYKANSLVNTVTDLALLIPPDHACLRLINHLCCAVLLLSPIFQCNAMPVVYTLAPSIPEATPGCSQGNPFQSTAPSAGLHASARQLPAAGRRPEAAVPVLACMPSPEGCSTGAPAPPEAPQGSGPLWIALLTECSVGDLPPCCKLHCTPVQPAGDQPISKPAQRFCVWGLDGLQNAFLKICRFDASRVACLLDMQVKQTCAQSYILACFQPKTACSLSMPAMSGPPQIIAGRTCWILKLHWMALIGDISWGPHLAPPHIRSLLLISGLAHLCSALVNLS